MPRYTRSKDGVLRANLRVEVRLDAEEIAELEAAAKDESITVSQFLSRALQDGLFRRLENYRSELEYQRKLR